LGAAAEGDFSGFASASPVVASNAVWVWYGTGVAACYALDGTRLWAVPTGMPWSEVRGPAPVLFGDVLLLNAKVRINDQEEGIQVKALDARSGKELWQRTVSARTPGLVPLDLRNRDQSRGVVVTTAGQVLCVQTGKVLREEIVGESGVAAQITADGQTVYFNSGGVDFVMGGWVSGWKSAVRLWLDEAGRVGCRLLWRSKGPSRYSAAAPLAHGNEFYIFCPTTEHHMEYPNPRLNVHIYDTETGGQLVDLKPLMDEGLSPVSVVLAGRYLFCTEGGFARPFVNNPHPRMAVVALGDDPLGSTVVAENEIPGTYANPVFDGDRMFMTGAGLVMCLATRSPMEREQEAALVAQSVFDGIRSWRVPPAVSNAPRALASMPLGGPLWRMESKAMPDSWLVLGPCPGLRPDPPPFVAAPDLILANPGGSVELEGQAWPLQPLASDCFIKPFHNYVRAGNEWYYSLYHALNTCALSRNTEQTQTYLFTVVENPRPATYQLNVFGPGGTVWLGGEEIKPGTCVTLREGYYPLVLRLQVNRIPKFLGQDMTLLYRLGFLRVRSLEEERAERAKRIRRYECQLKSIVQEMPNTPQGKQAADMLQSVAR
jgi:hypothetical protein